jgi:hypothetical protein
MKKKFYPSSQSLPPSFSPFYTFLIMIIIFLIIFYTVLYFVSKKKEYFGRFTVLNKEDTINFFKNDIDNYIKNLSEYDIKAQRSKSKSEYKNKIIQSADSFRPEEIQKLKIACRKADEALKKINIPGFDGIKASNLDWNIALTRGRNYEDGLPHTRLNTIFITDNTLKNNPIQLAKTMLHEKVHVYERLFPSDIEVWIKHNGFKPYKKWDSFKIARSNPDINEWSYLDPKGRPMVVLYKNNNPKSIHDVRYLEHEDPASEHPYETLAYTLEKFIN